MSGAEQPLCDSYWKTVNKYHLHIPDTRFPFQTTFCLSYSNSLHTAEKGKEDPTGIEVMSLLMHDYYGQQSWKTGYCDIHDVSANKWHS